MRWTRCIFFWVTCFVLFFFDQFVYSCNHFMVSFWLIWIHFKYPNITNAIQILSKKRKTKITIRYIYIFFIDLTKSITSFFLIGIKFEVQLKIMFVFKNADDIKHKTITLNDRSSSSDEHQFRTLRYAHDYWIWISICFRVLNLYLSINEFTFLITL